MNRQVVLSLLCLAAPLQAQCELDALSAQVGNGFGFGYAVAMSEEVLAISNTSSELIELYNLGEDGLGEDGAPELSGRVEARYTYVLDASQDRVILGEPIWALGAPDGTASILERTAAGWSKSPLVVPGGGVSLSYGSSVAIDGDLAVVGNSDLIGSVVPKLFVFERRPAGWVFREEIESPDGSGYQNYGFGSELSLHGTSLLVGASTTGRAYLFDLQPHGAAVVDTIDTGAPFFGSGVALGKEFAVVGAAPYSGFGDDEVLLFVYRRKAVDRGASLTLVATISTFAPAGPSTEYGPNLSLSGSRLVASVGGKVELFELSESSASLTNTPSLGLTGSAISVTSAGESFAIGLPQGSSQPGRVSFHNGKLQPCTAAIPKLFSSIPTQLPSVVAGNGFDLTVSGAGLQEVERVFFDGVELLNSPGSTSWLESGGATLALRTPLPETLGETELRVEAPLGSATLGIERVPSDPPAIELNGGVTPSNLTSILPSTVTIGGQPGHVAATIVSLSSNPTFLPGLPDLALGDGGSSFVLLPEVSIGSAGWTQFAQPISGLPPGTDLFIQVVAIDPATFELAVSNLWTSTYLF